MTTLTWFDKTIKNYQKALEIKIFNIYILQEDQKNAYIKTIQNIDNIDILIDLDYKLSEILKKLWSLAIKLLSGEDKEVLGEFLKQMKGVFDVKEEPKEFIDLSEIDENIDL